MSDKELLQHVLAELEWEPRLDATNVAVAVKNGVVTLAGHVETYAEKVAAEAASRRIRSVRAVANDLEVRPPHTNTGADDEIASRAANILAWDVSLPAGTIKPTVAKGWVTLTGQVDWQFQRSVAEDRVRMLGGVKGVINNITIKPRLIEADVRQRIEDALKRNASIDARDIQVTASGSKVFLDGAVHSLHERDVLETAVWAAPGVSTVEDRIRIE